MEEHERQALFGMLVKQVETGQTLTKQRKIVADANELINAATKAQANLKSGFLAFGFESGTTEAWTKIRDAIGQAAYNRALAIGNGSYKPALQITHQESKEKYNNEQDLDDIDGLDEHKANEIEKLDENVAPKIREIVIEKLKEASPEGIKTTDTKAFIETTYKIEIHEKTVGMTLWRLAKEGKARRDGRQWFYIASQDELEEDDIPF